MRLQDKQFKQNIFVFVINNRNIYIMSNFSKKIKSQVENLDRTGFYVGNSHSNLEKQLFKLAEIIHKLNKRIN